MECADNDIAERLRVAEFLAALSLATDMGMGRPPEQALRTWIDCAGVWSAAGSRADDLADVYYVALLRFLGCTAAAHEFATMPILEYVCTDCRFAGEHLVRTARCAPP